MHTFLQKCSPTLRIFGVLGVVDISLFVDEMMYALVERGARTLSEGNYQIFCDIDALAVSMSQKFLRSFF